MAGTSTNPKLDLDALAVAVVQQSARLTRLVFAKLDVALNRSEAAVLVRLEGGPRRISSLVESESLAQPTVTLLVKHLESLGLLARTPDPDDRRASLISLTEAGREALAEVRGAYRTVLRAHLARLSEAERSALVAALAVQRRLIEALQGEA